MPKVACNDFERPSVYKASDLNRGDAREIFREAEEAERSARFRRGLKYTINIIFSWGIEERLINGVHQSPVFGLEIEPDREEKRKNKIIPGILSGLEPSSPAAEVENCIN